MPINTFAPIKNNVPVQNNSTVMTPQVQTTQPVEPKGLSTSAKVGIGAAALGAITIGVLLAKGKFSQAKQLAEHIDFKPATTVKEAKQFAKDNLGVNIKFDDIDMINYINEALVQVNNATKGKSVMPKSVFVDNTHGFYAWRTYPNKPDDLIISPMAYKMGANAKKNGMSVKDYYMKAMFENSRFADKGLSPFKEIFHELGHGNHHATCKDYDKMSELKKLEAKGIGDKHFTEEFISETKNNKVVKEFFDSVGYTREDGSIYALNSPVEFIAEVFSLKLQGKSIPKEIECIYQKYGGPIVG